MTTSVATDQHAFETALDRQFANEDAVRCAIEKYFGTEGGVFTGSLFELLVDTDPYRFTAHDVVSLSALSEAVPPRVAYWLLSSDGQERTAHLLRRVPANVDIWDDDAAALLARGGPLWELWDLLGRGCWPQQDSANGMGTTRTSKLLAAKRPRLVPVWDGVVSATLPASNIWAAMQQALRNPHRRRRIETLTSGAPAHVSLLRRIDAAVWYLNRRSQAPKTDRSAGRRVDV